MLVRIVISEPVELISDSDELVAVVGEVVEGESSLPSSPAVWDPGRQRVSWLSHHEEQWVLAVAAGRDSAKILELGWANANHWLNGLAQQASGRLITIRTRVDEERHPIPRTAIGVVFESTGELVTTFDVEPGSELGGYDPSGLFLIYVDREGTVRWQGGGAAGELGDGYIFASW